MNDSNPYRLDALVALPLVAQAWHCSTIGSTNDWARQQASDRRLPLPALYLADEQTAGRGRGTNRWWTGSGSIALSLVLPTAEFGVDLARGAPLSLIVGVAVVEALLDQRPNAVIGLRWPNDIYAGPRKLGGILVEGLASGRAIIGIGLNLNNRTDQAPDDVRRRMTSLVELTARSCDRTSIVASILARLEDNIALYVADPAQLGERFDEFSVQRGQMLSIDTPTGEVRGLCAGIAADGALLLHNEQGQQRIYSGSVRQDG